MNPWSPTPDTEDGATPSPTRPDRTDKDRATGPRSDELLITRLLRAADGDRAVESAIILLSDSGLLGLLPACTIIDIDRQMAWIDWSCLDATAGHANSDVNALLSLASAIARQPAHRSPDDRNAVHRALHHLMAVRP